MQRRIVGCILVLLFFCWLTFQGMTTKAVQLPRGLLIGDDQGLNVTKNGNYFFRLEHLSPGETITRQLTIENRRTEPYRLELAIEPGVVKGQVNLLREITMTITEQGHQLYHGNLVNQNVAETHQGTVLSFGTVPANRQRQIEIQLEVNSALSMPALANESSARVRWRFSATSQVSPIEDAKGHRPLFGGRLPQLGQAGAKIGLVLLGSLLILSASLSRKRRRGSKK